MGRYFVMVIAVLVFYLLVKRKGFSKKLAIAAGIFDILIFIILLISGYKDPLLYTSIVPWFFICYGVSYLISSSVKKMIEGINDTRTVMKKRKKFKERQKIAESNNKVKTYKGAKKK